MQGKICPPFPVAAGKSCSKWEVTKENAALHNSQILGAGSAGAVSVGRSCHCWVLSPLLCQCPVPAAGGDRDQQHPQLSSALASPP